MNTKLKSNSVTLILLILVLTAIAACKQAKEEKHDHKVHNHSMQTGGAYICPMGCEGDKTYTKPGKCPVCNMDLTPVKAAMVQSVSPDKLVLSDQATVKLKAANIEEAVKAQGLIEMAMDRNLSVAARFGGRIERLYVTYEDQFIKKGEKVMDIYSPSLQTMQEEHLLLLRSGRDEELIRLSREKLYLLGISEAQVRQLEKNGSVTLTISVFSPASGYVFFSATRAPSGAAMSAGTGMNTMGMSQPTVRKVINYDMQDSQIREGMYVNAGQTLFTVNDLQQVWAMISIPNSYAGQIRDNETLRLYSETDPSKELQGKVSLTEQVFDESNQRFVRVRVVLPNADRKLKLNTLVDAEIPLTGDKGMVVPSSAVYKAGENAYVWVKSGTTDKGTGIFKAKKIVAGASANGHTTIMEGIGADTEIALEAGLMTDSQTFIKEY